MKVTETQLVTLVATLKLVSEPLAARKLGPALVVPGRDAESKRRRVREVVDAARSEPYGYRICANGDGYWLARSGAEWHDYLESRGTGARFEFVKVRRMRQAAGERTNRQGMLPGMAPTAVDLMPS